MKQTVDVAKKYGACVAPNALENSTLAAAAALASYLKPFVTVLDTYVNPPSAGFVAADGAVPRYSLAEMTTDKVPTNIALLLYLDVQPLSGGKIDPINVGITIQELRFQPNDAAGAIAKAIGGNSDTVLSLFTRAVYGNVVADLNSKAAAVIAVEDNGN
jgi:hypothetical protein